MQLFKIICSWRPKIWFPLAIVLLKGVIDFLYRGYIFADLFENPGNIQIIGGFFDIATALIGWILISVLLFFGCRLLCGSKGVFLNFFKVVGLCHLVLLVATLGQFIFTLIRLPPDLKPSETTFEALGSVAPIVQGINIAGHICFGVILVGVVQTFFEIRSGQALFITCISYAIYWVLSGALGSLLLYVFTFFFGQFLVPSWQPVNPILP